jgi:hypothetical protein
MSVTQSASESVSSVNLIAALACLNAVVDMYVEVSRSKTTFLPPVLAAEYQGCRFALDAEQELLLEQSETGFQCVRCDNTMECDMSLKH